MVTITEFLPRLLLSDSLVCFGTQVELQAVWNIERLLGCRLWLLGSLLRGLDQVLRCPRRDQEWVPGLVIGGLLGALRGPIPRAVVDHHGSRSRPPDLRVSGDRVFLKLDRYERG